MPDTNLAPVCGIYCGACEHLGTRCQGCGYINGQPFWTSQFKMPSCPLYDCCINNKKLEHCGLCEELPCKTFIELRDPELSDEEAENSILERTNELLKRKEVGTESWLLDKENS